MTSIEELMPDGQEDKPAKQHHLAVKLVILALAFGLILPVAAFILDVIVSNLLNYMIGPGRVENYWVCLLPACVASVAYPLFITMSQDPSMVREPKKGGRLGWLVLLLLLWVVGLVLGSLMKANPFWMHG